MRLKRLFKGILFFLLGLFGFLLLIFIYANLPSSQRFISKKVNGFFITSHLPIQISSVNKILPGKVYAVGVLIKGSENDTIVYAGTLKADFKLFALLRQRVIIKSAELNKIRVNIKRNSKTNGLNISDAFSDGLIVTDTSQNTNKKQWEITILKADLSEILFRMADSLVGIYIDEHINRLKFEADKMSIVEKTLSIVSLELEGATGTIRSSQNNSKKISIEDNGPGWVLGLRELNAININQVYDDFTGKFKIDLVSGELKIETRNTDLVKKIIDFRNISISKTSIILNMDLEVKNPEENKKVKDFTFLWDIEGDNIDMEEVSCSMYKYSDSIGRNPLSNINIRDLSLQLSGLKLSPDIQTMNIKKLNFDLGNGFSIKKMKASVDSQSDKTKIELEAETGESSLNIKATADQSIMEFITDSASSKKAKISIDKSRFSLNDLFYFRSDLQADSILRNFSTNTVNLDSEVELTGSSVTLHSFSLGQASNFRVNLQGTAENIFNTENFTGDINFSIENIDNLWVKDILGKLLPEMSVPDYKFLAIEGNLSDSLMAPDFNIKIKSDLGIANLNGTFDFNKDLFSLKSDFERIKIGAILKNKLIGSFSGSADIGGSGIKAKSIIADLVITVDSLYFNDYTYTNTIVEGKISKDNFEVFLKVDDPFLKLNLNTAVKIAGSLLSAKADGIFFSNLNMLHLYKDTLSAGGNLSADFLIENGKINSNLVASDINLITHQNKATIKKAKITFESDSANTKLTVESDLLNSQIFIAESAGKLGTFLKDYLAYFKAIIDTRHAETLKHISSLPEMNAKINVYYNKAFRIFIPDTSLFFRKLSCTVNTKISESKINYDVSLTGLEYKKFNIENIRIGLKDSASVMDLVIDADTCQIASQPVNNIHLTSHFVNWHSLTDLSAIDRKGNQIYNLEISSSNDTSNIYLQIPSEQITLNGTEWSMDSPDLLKINRITKALSPSLSMHTDSSFIKLYTEEETGFQKFTLELGNVDLASVYRTDMMPGKPEATITGNSVLNLDESGGKKVDTDMKFTDVSWSDLKYNQLSLKGFYSSESADVYNMDLTAVLDSAEISIIGKKQLNETSTINAKFKLIPVNSVQPFVKQFLTNLKGSVSGDFNLSAKANIESLAGELLVHDVNLKINSLNSSYSMPEERISFAGKKMILKNFKVLDSLNNELFIDGNVDFSNKKSVMADFEISSSDLQVMNRKEEKNSSFYGNIFVDTKLSIKGPVTSPLLKGKVTLTKGTDIYFRQKDNLSLSESEKVLTFVSSNKMPGDINLREVAGKSLYNKTSVESVVVIDPDTRLSIELSKKMFNIGLTIQGGGELYYNMLVNSRINLTGKYEVNEGSANLKMIGWPNKAFKITKGGFIRWDGKLDDPELSFEAINKVTSSYVNPVDNKERYVNFDVTLKISNRLSEMDVTFTLNTADQYLMSIINTLSPEEQMRQAITILLFENVDLPGISTTSNYVSEQVNQMVASQLNALTKTSIKGIDISFGIDSYVQANATGGQQAKTSLSYEVKRKLLNDRAQIELSGRINDGSSHSKSTDYSLNNVSFEYRLDSAGTKFLKVYNEHTYEDVFVGEVIKTGVGLTYRKNYPLFSDIWKKDEEKKRRRDAEKKRRREGETKRLSDENLIKQDNEDR